MKTTPCIGCGYCCIQAMCAVGSKHYEATIERFKERCPYLVWVNDKYRCKLVIDRKVRPEELFIGDGCSSSLFNTWRQDVRER